MKKAVLASMLAAVAVAVPFCAAHAQDAGAAPAGGQTPAAGQAPAGQTPAAGQAAGGQVQLSQPEYAAYQNVTTATDMATKASAAETFLTQFPQSSVKGAVLEQLVVAYSAQNNVPKALDASDRLLQADPNNIRGLLVETTLLKGQGDSSTDAAAKQASYDKAASFATRGLAATKPASIEQSAWDTLKTQVTPYFYSAIGADALQKKDMPGAIAAFTSELKAVPEAQTSQPGPFLQDTYYLGTAYYQSTPPDYLNCTYFATRVAGYAPANFKSQFQPLATYCYKKYHGGDDGYDAVKTAAAASLFPPASFASSVKPAPTPEDTVKQVLSSTPDLSKLALSDREYIIQNGTADEADKVFAPIKGKEVKVSGTVVAISGTDLQLAVSDDSKAATPKVADFDITLTAEPKTPPAVDATVDVVATFDSYTQKPVMIKMTGGEVQSKKAAAAPVHRAPARRR